jgi:hypothetical protein
MCALYEWPTIRSEQSLNTAPLVRFLASEPPTTGYVALEQTALVNKFSVLAN